MSIENECVQSVIKECIFFNFLMNRINLKRQILKKFLNKC